MPLDRQSPCSVLLGPLGVAAELELAWRELESRADATFFSSWSWVGCWLKSLPASFEGQLLRAELNGAVVGLAIVVASAARRFRLLPMRLVALHSTGVPRYDTLTIEHNDFLVDRDHANDVRCAMFDCLARGNAYWDRLLLPGLCGAARQCMDVPPNTTLSERSNPCYLVELGPMADGKRDYLDQLTGNTRQQIRQSLKAYQQRGPIELTQAEDIETAHEYLDRLITLHQARWTSKGRSGAFNDHYFVDFHRQLIERSFERKEIQMLRVRVGGTDLGYLYNFVHRGRVLFYQSGFDYDLIEKHGRPGLVMHTLAVRHNAGLGHHTYDFLAGAARYKKSLSTSFEVLSWIVLHRQTRAFKIESVLRKCKRYFDSRRAVDQRAHVD
jgi:CelD/BcsL family acetyltransferase involved in cellulose biosynthesis